MVKLEIQFNPEPARNRVISDLRTAPPAALLVWADWIPSPEIYTAPYLAAANDGIAEILGTSSGSMSYEETVDEFVMHMRSIVPLLAPPEPAVGEGRLSDWTLAGAEIIRLCGPHIELTGPARKMLKNNPYPDSARMVQFFGALADLARLYHERKGDLGRGLTDTAMSEFGIEIALFDGRLNGIKVDHDGRAFDAGPHVKVDDAKAPDKCGRIYFSMDSERHRFIVDHIGLHDYRE